MNTYPNTIYNMSRDSLEQAIRPIFLSKDQGMLRKKVEHVRSLTHFSKAESEETYRPGGTFSVEGAIRAQVEREDLIRWSHQPSDFRTVPGLPDAPGTPSVGLRNLIRSFMP